ncbi:MAG: hypothetical protein ACYC2W_00305 [Desulfurivibrionaceae bacterium]
MAGLKMNKSALDPEFWENHFSMRADPPFSLRNEFDTARSRGYCVAKIGSCLAPIVDITD